MTKRTAHTTLNLKTRTSFDWDQSGPRLVTRESNCSGIETRFQECSWTSLEKQVANTNTSESHHNAWLVLVDCQFFWPISTTSLSLFPQGRSNNLLNQTPSRLISIYNTLMLILARGRSGQASSDEEQFKRFAEEKGSAKWILTSSHLELLSIREPSLGGQLRLVNWAVGAASKLGPHYKL